MFARLFITACALLAASEVSATYRTPPMSGPPRWSQVHWPAPPIRWTCVVPGFQEVDVGARACLRTGDGWRTATCTLVFNMTNWEIGGETCRAGAEPERPR